MLNFFLTYVTVNIVLSLPVPSIPIAPGEYFTNYTWLPKTELGVALLNYSCPPGSIAVNEALLPLMMETVLVTMQTGLYYVSGPQPDTDRYGVNDPLLNNRIYCQGNSLRHLSSL